MVLQTFDPENEVLRYATTYDYDGFFRNEISLRAAMMFPPYYIPCGWQGNFYQVNLKVIADGRVPMDDFVDAFMASANGINAELTQPFIEDWTLIQKAIRTVSPDMEGFSKDSTLIANLLQEGKYVMHHSEKFNEHYHPHYRIIRRDLFEEKILPKLK